MKIDLRGVHLGQGMFSSQKRKNLCNLLEVSEYFFFLVNQIISKINF